MLNAAVPDPVETPLTSVTPIRAPFDLTVFSLPPQLPTPFFGREQEIAQVRDLLAGNDVRLLTLTGPGGVGKTRLAIRLAHDLAPSFADGAAMISLATVPVPDLLAQVIARSLGVREGVDLTATERLHTALRSKHVLLLLDNFEQIIAAAATVADLLAACPDITVLVTSRLPLRIAGEQELSVPPFELPDGTITSLTELSTNPAIALFTQRASAVKADFVLHDANAQSIAAVCRRLDGLPLAIELAAARSKVLAPSAILARLTNSLDVLTGGPRDHPGRLQTMRAAIAWSYDLLSSDEQSFFDCLAIFSGGFSLEAAAAITETSAGFVLDTVTTLADNSLLRIAMPSDCEPRFSMLETMREFGLEKLEMSGRLPHVKQMHAAWYLNLADDAEAEVYGGPSQITRMDQLELEHDNLRAALRWAEASGNFELSLRLSGKLAFFWYVRGYFTEGQRWLTNALAFDNGAPDAVRAHALLGSGLIANYQGKIGIANQLIAESLTLTRRSGQSPDLIFALGIIGITAEDAGNYALAEDYFQQALDHFNETGGDGPGPSLMGELQTHMGVAAWGLGDADRATSILETALVDQRDRTDYWGMANSLRYLALIACERGQLDQSARLEHESLTLFWNVRGIDDIAGTLSNAACIFAARGEYLLAARIFGAAGALRDEIGSQAALPERLVYERTQERVRNSLPARSWNSAWDAGRSLPTAEAVAETLESLASLADSTSSVAPQPGVSLTSREIDVLRLLVAGQTDREIASTLYISPRTAQGHVARLFDKLGVSTRTAAVALALQENLLTAPSPAT